MREQTASERRSMFARDGDCMSRNCWMIPTTSRMEFAIVELVNQCDRHRRICPSQRIPRCIVMPTSAFVVVVRSSLIKSMRRRRHIHAPSSSTDIIPIDLSTQHGRAYVTYSKSTPKFSSKYFKTKYETS